MKHASLLLFGSLLYCFHNTLQIGIDPLCHVKIVAWSSKIWERTDRWQLLSNFWLSKPTMDVYSRKEVSGTVCSLHLLQPCKICQAFQEFSGIFRNIQQISEGLIKRLVALFRHGKLFILWPQLGWVLLVKKLTLFQTEFTYLIFVIFFTLAKYLENKIYTEKRQFFALNL